MHGDTGYWLFFAYVGLFVFSMTMLVSVSNFALLYVFWEAVGLCSYLLVGFWFEKPSAAAAGMKAMLVNRVGDFGFALGLFLIWMTFGTLDYHDSKVDTLPAANGQPAAPIVVYLDPSKSEERQCCGYGHARHLRALATDAEGAFRYHVHVDYHGNLSPALRRRLRQERAVSAARLAPGRHGRPDRLMQLLHPRGDDSHQRLCTW